MAKFDLAAMQKLDRNLTSNVFEAGYTGLTEGVVMSLDRGPDPLRPRDPSIAIGLGFIARDRFVDRELGPMGCIYHPMGGQQARVYRAVVHTVVPEGRKPFSVLRAPAEAKPATSLLKVSLELPKGTRVKTVKGADGAEHALRIWSGVRTTGKLVIAYDGEALVELSPGDELTILFEDGLVRQYEQDKDGLLEVELSPADMAELRIDDARQRLAAVTPQNWPNPEKREAQLRFILSGIVDLFHLAAKDEGVRKDLAQFFFNLDQSLLGLIHRKLVAVLHLRDPLLAHAFSTPTTSSNVAPMRPAKTAAEIAEAARKRAVADARKQKLRTERLEAQPKKGASGGGGGKQSQKKGKK